MGSAHVWPGLQGGKSWFTYGEVAEWPKAMVC